MTAAANRALVAVSGTALSLLLIAAWSGCRRQPRPARRRPPDPAVAAVRRAVLSGDDAALDRLLADNPALANEPDDDGVPPLIHAVSARRVDIIADLLARGANINARGPNGGTALMRANDATIIHFLLAHGADLNARDRYGHSALWWRTRAAQGSGPGARVAAAQLAIARDLLAEGAQEDVFSASALGDTGALRVLLARDPALARARDGGSTPLHWAAQHCQQSAATLLIARGADPQARDIAGFTPAQVAVEQGCLRLAQKLDGGASSAR